MNAEDRLVIALDTPDVAAAERVVSALGAAGRFYKIGYQLMPLGGYDLARRLADQGKRVFIDAKFHDIGATVERGAKSVAKLGADFLTVHAERDVVAGAVAGRADDPRLKIIAVTVLTSLTQESLAASGVTTPLADLVLKRAEIALAAGADGVVASPHEAAAIRARFGDRLLIITPGVRPAGVALDDQARAATPAAAIHAGADYLVVGRPILSASDPAAAARAIAAEMASAA
jgi:orotidine-5'-phosphate decarboxylase